MLVRFAKLFLAVGLLVALWGLSNVGRRSDYGTEEMVSGAAVGRMRSRIVFHGKRKRGRHPVRRTFHLLQFDPAWQVSSVQSGFHPQ